MASPEISAADAAYWYVPLARAVPAAALALVITFAGGFYTPEYGLASFGGYALVAGAVGCIVAVRALPTGVDRTVFLMSAGASVAAGVGALTGVHLGLTLLIAVVGLWGAVTGGLELVAGIRSRRARGSARDWIFIGALTLVLAVVCFVIPPDYVQHYNAPDDGGARVLNASVMVVGALAVYGAIAAVYLVIAGLSLRWSAASVGKKGIAP